ncbi:MULTISPECIES: porin [Paraburkholderia]|jgi:predicted porin|uniref:Porin n=1 Tax=Paraburkholderia largidicola TaxID=3014751 RepID=A0A7I8BWN3_9BURK|nr:MULTISPECIES: porin [Paraburkholderia]BCF92983.1 porin [Paraburkholderia sp. PGU16]GJG99520.1 porin [Paraburkholderia terrae]GJH33490.1 porin [Paraburkholderia hospita]CAG9243622.1 Outer membrane porin OpcP [Paraburkholderia caribensis]
MKKTLCALALIAPLYHVAYAQSSVTLAGIIDVGINDVTNAGGAHQYMMSSGVNNGSRFIFRGIEDLGGGLKSIFFLENGFNVNNGTIGQGGLLFGRQAYVGLTSDRFGSVTLGRQYDSMVDYVGQLTAADNWGGYISAHPGDLDNFNNSYRTNNSIKYTSPTFSGLTFGGVYSLGGVAGDATRNQVWSIGGGYAGGPFNFGVAVLNARNPNLSFFGNNSQTPLTASTANGTVTPVYSGFMSAHSYTVIGAAAAYTIGGSTVSVSYSNVRFSDLGDTSSGPNPSHYTGTAMFNNAEIAYRFRPAPDWLLGAAYDFTDGNGAGGNGGARYHQGELTAQYFLSKRTTVYVLGVYQRASGTDSTGKPAVAAINLLTPSKSDTQGVIRVGFRHKF